MPRLVLRALVGWFAILVGAILNGALREAILVPAVGWPWALILSGLLLAMVVALVAWIFVARHPDLSPARCLQIGGFWLALTLAFEFSFGHLVQGKQWRELMSAYWFENGNLWPLVLLTVLLAPWAIARLGQRR